VRGAIPNGTPVSKRNTAKDDGTGAVDGRRGVILESGYVYGTTWADPGGPEIRYAVEWGDGAKTDCTILAVYLEAVGPPSDRGGD